MMTVLAAAAALAMGAPMAAGAPLDERAGSCRPTSAVIGTVATKAIAMLEKRGCTNVRVRLECAPRDHFGRVLRIRPSRGTWPADEVITVWRGVRRTPAGPCPVTDYDGIYEFSGNSGMQTCRLGSTVVPTPLNLLPDGQPFTIQDAEFGGDPLFGSVNDDGTAAVTMFTHVQGFPELTGQVVFAANQDGTMATSGTLTGRFTSNQTVCTIEQSFNAVRVEEDPD